MLLGMRSPKVGPTPVGAWRASTSTLAQLAALVSHSRTSLATMFDSTGKLTYAPNNLLLQSNTFSNAAWTKSNVTISSGVTDPLGGSAAFTLTATAAGGYLQQIITTLPSSSNITSFWIRRRSGTGNVRLNANVTNPIQSVTGAWAQFYTTQLSNGSGLAWNGILLDVSGDAVDIYAATLSAVTYETSPRTADQVITTSSAYYGPRIDYDPNTLAVKGLLIEEARTNQNKSSADIAGAGWTAGAGVTIGAATTAPDGTSNAKLYQSTGALDWLYNTSAVAIASPFASSVYLKYGGTGRWFILSSYGTGGAQLWIDLLNGVIGTSSNWSGIGTVITPTITPINNGWYRLTLGTSAGATHNYLQINSVDADNSIVQANGTVYVWGAQTEAGSFATSYIPTAAASVTRAADVVQFTGAALTALQGSAGSAIVQMADQSVGYGATGGVVLGGSSTYWLDLASGNMYSNSGGHFLNTANAAVAGSPYRASVAWNASGRSLAMNGGTVATDAFGGWAATTPYLGSLSGTANFANGHVASFAIYNQRLPDATLQARSVVGVAF